MKNITNARYIAIETLRRLQKTRLPVSTIINKLFKQYSPADKDHHLIMNIIFGVLRQRDYLDLLMSTLCNKPIKKLKPAVYQAISVGLYQIFFLDRIPNSAAVNETVNALKITKTPKSLIGLANGVLRASIRKKDKLPTAKESAESNNPILNHPKWLVKRWQQRYGLNIMREICKHNNIIPKTVLRINESLISKKDFCNQLSENNIDYSQGQYSPTAIILPDFGGKISTLPGYNKGYFQIQDESAQLISLLFGPLKANGIYLDGCAGLGGKTINLIQLGPESKIIAVEPSKSRAKKFKENILRLFPDKKVEIFNNTLEEYSLNHDNLFDGILIDAPCSGLGVTGRHPDIRWNRTEKDLAHYQKTQLNLLSTAATLVKPEGIIIYATCSIEPEENENVVSLFLANNNKFILDDCRDVLPPQAQTLVTNKFLCPLPTSGTDGFFAARFRKKLIS